MCFICGTRRNLKGYIILDCTHSWSSNLKFDTYKLMNIFIQLNMHKTMCLKTHLFIKQVVYLCCLKQTSANRFVCS